MLKIKSAKRDTVIAFGKTGGPLGKRSQEDLLDLAIMARQANHKHILDNFEEPLPSLDELKALKLKTAEAKVKASKPQTAAPNDTEANK